MRSSGERREEATARTYAEGNAHVRTLRMYVRLFVREKRQQAKVSFFFALFLSLSPRLPQTAPRCPNSFIFKKYYHLGPGWLAAIYFEYI